MSTFSPDPAMSPADRTRFHTPGRTLTLIERHSPIVASLAQRLRANDHVRALLMIGLLPNVILVPNSIWGSRALVNVEYLVIAAFERYMSRAMLVVLLSITLLLDVLITFAPVFNFGPTEIVAAVQQLAHFRGRAIVIAIAVMALIVAMAAAVVRLRGRPRPVPGGTRRLFLLCGGAAVAFVGLDIANGSHALFWRARTVVGIDVATSMLASEYMTGLRQAPDYGQITAAATDDLRAALAGATPETWKGPRKVVLVIMESMGLPKGTSMREIWAPFMNDAISKRYEVRTGTVPFLGATTAGEFRELCGIRLTHLAVRGATLPPCVPQQLRSLGYETYAMHGYNGMLFQRLEWYPRVGFDRMAFDDDLSARPGVVKCGRLFHGVCDSTAVSIIREELARDPQKRELVYWLTLSSHFPLGKPRYDGEGCHAVGSAGEIELTCQLWTAIWPALTGLAEIAADTSIAPAWYVIVGDHMPPQLLPEGYNHPSYPPRDRQRPSRFQEDRLAFSTTEVPYIELRPISR